MADYRFCEAKYHEGPRKLSKNRFPERGSFCDECCRDARNSGRLTANEIGEVRVQIALEKYSKEALEGIIVAGMKVASSFGHNPDELTDLELISLGLPFVEVAGMVGSPLSFMKNEE